MAKSKALQDHHYNPMRMDLVVQFTNGKQYVYTPVSPSLNQQFVSASSKGKFFNENIRDNIALTCMKVIV